MAATGKIPRFTHLSVTSWAPFHPPSLLRPPSCPPSSSSAHLSSAFLPPQHLPPLFSPGSCRASSSMTAARPGGCGAYEEVPGVSTRIDPSSAMSSRLTGTNRGMMARSKVVYYLYIASGRVENHRNSSRDKRKYRPHNSSFQILPCH